MSITLHGITLIPTEQKVTREDLRARFPNATTIVAADFYVVGAETWQEIPGGWQCKFEGVTFINVDHHAPAENMMRFVSSGNLASEYVRARSKIKTNEQTVVVINHCDCDSIISSSILVGFIVPEMRFQDAVIAADHTGEENDVADALQALESQKDLALSLRTIDAIRFWAELPPQAKIALRDRRNERASLAKLLTEKPERVHNFGSVVVVEGDERIAGEMLPALLPEAVLVVCTSPRDEEKFNVKVRLGAAAPSGATLFSLGLFEFDPAFGGRWNAGSNKRGDNGGTSLSPVEYGQRLAELILTKFS